MEGADGVEVEWRELMVWRELVVWRWSGGS